MSTIKDNPNPIANVGFLCYYPFQYFVYKNIYKHLPNAEFIVDDSYKIRGYEFPEALRERLFSFFAKQGIYWRKLQGNDTVLTKKEFFDKYGLIVSALYEDKIMGSPYFENKKLVRTPYGHAKDLWNFGPYNAYFDLVLSYGHYTQKFLNIYGNSVIVGNPKFDDWFEKKLNKKEKVRGTKKTILYLPTWGELSSLGGAVTAINALSKEYKVIIKVHHMTVLLHPEQLTGYSGNESISIVDDTADIIPLLHEADVVLSDNGGAIFDAILADKPIVLVNTHDAALIRPHNESLFYKDNGKNAGVATSSESIEQKVKEPGNAVGPIIDDLANGKNQINPKSLEHALNQAEAKEGVFRERRKLFRDVAFSYTDGSSGKRGAEEIKKLLYKPKQPKNFLAGSIDMYIRDFFSPKINQDQQNLIELGKKYRAIQSLPYFQKLRAIFENFFNV